MTTYLFQPTNTVTPPWQQQVTLDGDSYILSAFWNSYGQRWYLSLSTQDGTLVQFSPLISSTLSYTVPLFPGLFSASQVVYRSDAGTIEVTP